MDENRTLCPTSPLGGPLMPSYKYIRKFGSSPHRMEMMRPLAVWIPLLAMFFQRSSCCDNSWWVISFILWLASTPWIFCYLAHEIWALFHMRVIFWWGLNRYRPSCQPSDLPDHFHQDSVAIHLVYDHDALEPLAWSYWELSFLISVDLFSQLSVEFVYMHKSVFVLLCWIYFVLIFLNFLLGSDLYWS